MPSRARKLLFAAVACLGALVCLEVAGRLALPEPVPDIRTGTAGNLLPYDPDTRIVADKEGGRALAGGGTLRPQTWEMPATKYRIAVVGDSTVHGPFTDVLDAGLSLDRPHETLNFGVYGIASDRTRILASAALDQDLDLLVVYTGHNEYLEARLNPRSLLSFEDRRRMAVVTRGGIARLLRLFSPPPANHQQAGTGPDRAEFTAIGADEDARVLANYATNLEAICVAAKAAGVPVALVAPVSSLLRPPAHGLDDPCDGFLFGSFMKLKRDPTQNPADVLGNGPPLDAVSQAWLDGVFAAARGEVDAARASLLDAREQDPHHWRVTLAMKRELAAVAARCGATAIDPEPTLLADARLFALDDPLFVDQVHPSALGVRVLAPAVVAGLAPLLPPGATWKDPGPSVGGDPSRMTAQERGYRLP